MFLYRHAYNDSFKEFWSRGQRVAGCALLAAMLCFVVFLCPFVYSMQPCYAADPVIMACAMVAAVITELAVFSTLLFFRRFSEVMHPVSALTKQGFYARGLPPPSLHKASFSTPLRI